MVELNKEPEKKLGCFEEIFVDIKNWVDEDGFNFIALMVIAGVTLLGIIACIFGEVQPPPKRDAAYYRQEAIRHAQNGNREWAINDYLAYKLMGGKDVEMDISILREGD